MENVFIEHPWSIQDHLELLKGEIDKDDIEDGEPLKLPFWYDKEKYERGQKFFKKNYFALFVSKLAGLLAILTIPEINTILVLTHRSSTPAAAFKRYLATIAHMNIWYDHPMDNRDSWAWKSLRDVLNFHTAANKKGKQLKVAAVSQASLAITQFGFMGYAVLKPELLGIDTREGVEDFIHFWRVIGHIIGIQDRYNICRPSLDETRQLCQGILDELIAPRLKSPESSFLDLSKAMLKGTWAINFMVDVEAFSNYVLYLSDIKTKDFTNWYSRWLFNYQVFLQQHLFTIRIIGHILRVLLNLSLQWGLNMTMKCPLLAYFAFGVPLSSRIIKY